MSKQQKTTQKIKNNRQKSIKKEERTHLGYRCIGPTITAGKITKLQKQLDDNKEIEKVQNLLSVVSGKTRMKVLYLLNEQERLCVCDMADILDVTDSALSHQLKKLRENDLVETKKEGQTIFYSLSVQGKEIINNYF